MATYLFADRRIDSEDEAFADALAEAHADRQRPKCPCVVQGVEMYVARLGERFIVKRMPETGSRHASGCLSYEPPPEASGLGQLLGTAIVEDPATGETALRLGFTMSTLGARATTPTPVSLSDRVASEAVKLSLRGLLHYLWDQAELTRWQPCFAGKRSWSTVRKQLMLAAENKVARGEALSSRIYIPEPFSIDQRDVLNARRVAQWSQTVAAPGRPQQLMLLIGEVKEVVPARYGFKAVIKHVPDQAFAVDAQLYRRLGRCFNAELALWASTDSVHMIAIATFGLNEAGIPTIAELSLMPVTPQWLPIEDAFERQLIECLVTEGRAFIKGLRYNLRREQSLVTATLTDAAHAGSLMCIVPPGLHGRGVSMDINSVSPRADAQVWVWSAASEAMPQLPA